jgi:hypothetical protein
MKIGFSTGASEGGSTGVNEGAVGATGWNESVFTPTGTGFSPIGSPEGGILMGVPVGSTDGAEVPSKSLNSNPSGPPKGGSEGGGLIVSDFALTFVVTSTAGFFLTAKAFGVGSSVRVSPSLPPFGNT